MPCHAPLSPAMPRRAQPILAETRHAGTSPAKPCPAMLCQAEFSLVVDRVSRLCSYQQSIEAAFAINQMPTPVVSPSAHASADAVLPRLIDPLGVFAGSAAVGCGMTEFYKCRFYDVNVC